MNSENLIKEVERKLGISTLEKNAKKCHWLLEDVICHKWENHLYKESDILEWEQFCKEPKSLEVSILNYFLSKYPLNEFANDIQKNYLLSKKAKNLLKNYNIKKLKEFHQLFFSFNKNRFHKNMSISELVEYFNGQENESKGEWDFFNNNDKIFVELSYLHSAGSLTKKIQKYINTKDSQPIFDPIEIFEEAKRVIKKKVFKNGRGNENFYRIVLDIHAYGPNDSQFLKMISRQSKYKNIDMYIDYIKEITESEYLNFQTGEIVLSYGDFKTDFLILPINDFCIDFNNIIRGKNYVTFTVASKSSDSEKYQIKINEYITRVRGKENKVMASEIRNG